MKSTKLSAKILKNNLRKYYKEVRQKIHNDMETNKVKKLEFITKISEKLSQIITERFISSDNTGNIYISIYYPIQSEINCIEIFDNVSKTKFPDYFNYKLCLP